MNVNYFVCVVILIFKVGDEVTTASRIPHYRSSYRQGTGKTEIHSLPSSHPKPTTQTPKTLFDKIVLAFFKLPLETLNPLLELHQFLNKDGLVDTFHQRIESFGNESPVRLVPGFYTWLFTQDMNDIYRWFWSFDKCLRRFEKWLKKQNIWENYNTYDNQLVVCSNPSSHGQLTAEEFFTDFLTILWRLGVDNIYRLGELIQFLDPDGTRVIRMSLRLLSVNMGVSMALNSKQARENIMPQVAEWILAQDPENLKQCMMTGNSQMEEISEWMDTQGY